MSGPNQIYKDIYQIGGPAITGSGDYCVYLVDAGSELVMVDSGLGRSPEELVRNIENLELDLEKLEKIIATHGHIDHVGALAYFRERFDLKVIAHELDADRIETGRDIGAELYGVPYETCRVDVRLDVEKGSLDIGEHELNFLHVPGHTPGSIALYLDVGGKRVLFGQDIHGPYNLPGSDSADARNSLQKLLDLRADILCEGHYGIYRPEEEVEKYIRRYLEKL